MVHFCIFGAHEGRLTTGRKLYVTVFGACELTRPTIAKQIVEMRRQDSRSLTRKAQFFVTIFGGTDLKSPTLAEEYVDLQDALSAGLIKLEEWDVGIAQITANDSYAVGSLTLFGAFCAAELPSENEELDAMALSNYAGRVPTSAVNMLQLGVGQGGSNRSAIIRQAIATAQTATA